MLFLFKKKRLGHVKMLQCKTKKMKKKRRNIVSVLPLALKKMKGKKTNLREQTKPKYIINEKHAGNTYT